MSACKHKVSDRICKMHATHAETIDAILSTAELQSPACGARVLWQSMQVWRRNVVENWRCLPTVVKRIYYSMCIHNMATQFCAVLRCTVYLTILVKVKWIIFRVVVFLLVSISMFNSWLSIIQLSVFHFKTKTWNLLNTTATVDLSVENCRCDL